MNMQVKDTLARVRPELLHLEPKPEPHFKIEYNFLLNIQLKKTIEEIHKKTAYYINVPLFFYVMIKIRLSTNITTSFFMLFLPFLGKQDMTNGGQIPPPPENIT